MQGTKLLSVGVVGVLLVSLVAGAGLGLGTSADPASQSATVSTIDSCTTIEEPGRYELGGNVSNATHTGCIEITASDVILDGNGHSLNGPTEATDEYDREHISSGVYAHGNVSNVTVTDVHVVGWRDGVLYRSVDGGLITDISRTNAALDWTLGPDGIGSIAVLESEDVTVTDSRIYETMGHLTAEGEDLTVRNTTVANVTDTESVVLSGDVAFRDNTVRNSSGVYAGGEGVEVRNNRFDFAGRTGFSVAGENATVASNTLRGHVSILVTEPGGMVTRNDIVSSADRPVGIYADDVVFHSNTIDSTDPTGGGLEVEDANGVTVRNNTLTNTSVAFRQTSDTRVAGNTMTAGSPTENPNGGPSLVLLERNDDATITDNDVAGTLRGQTTGETVTLARNTVGENLSLSDTSVADLDVRANDVGGTINLDNLQTANVTLADNRIGATDTGLYVSTSTGASPSVSVRNNSFVSPAVGIDIATISGELSITGNDVTADDIAVRIRAQPNSTVECIDGNLTNRTDAGADVVTLRDNVLDGGSFGVQNADDETVDAAGNYWGAASGPSSPGEAALEDPETGALADGDGSAVSAGQDTGVSNVHFDDWLAAAP